MEEAKATRRAIDFIIVVEGGGWWWCWLCVCAVGLGGEESEPGEQSLFVCVCAAGYPAGHCPNNPTQATIVCGGRGREGREAGFDHQRVGKVVWLLLLRKQRGNKKQNKTKQPNKQTNKQCGTFAPIDFLEGASRPACVFLCGGGREGRRGGEPSQNAATDKNKAHNRHKGQAFIAP